jgi:hypothetical protein
MSVMKKREAKTESKDQPERKPYRVRLPGFISDKEVGLGDIIKRATYAVGIKPCGGCTRRASALNRWMTFSGKR